MKWTSWFALIGLVVIGGLVVYSSLTVGGVRYEVCIDFEGAPACRSVDGATEAEARLAARTNVCARLASGVTQTTACERTTPTSEACHARG
jgi:hypothetical protein